MTTCVLAIALLGQTVKLPATVTVEVGRLAAVAVDYDGDDCRWDIPPDLDAFREYDPDPKKIRLRLIGYKAGTHRVIAVACKGGKLSEFAACVVTVGKPGPGPKPPPEPDDGGDDSEPDNETAKHLIGNEKPWVRIVERSAQRSPATVAVLNSAKVSQWIKAADGNYLEIEVDSPDQKAMVDKYNAAYAKQESKPAEYPYVIIGGVDAAKPSTMRYIAGAPLPKTEQDMLAWLAKYGVKK